MSDNPVALVPTPLCTGQLVTLRWRGRGGVPLALDGEPAVVLDVGARTLLVATAEGARRVALDVVEELGPEVS